MKPRPLGLIACACAAFALLSTGYAAWVEDWTFDEAFHLRWSERLLDEGVTERLSAERLDTKTPVMIPNVLARRAAERTFPGQPRLAKWAARAPGLMWLLLGLVAVALLAREELSPRAAAIAVAGVALDPNMTAHASVATVDAAYATLTVATLLAALRFARAPTLARGAMLGVALGAALATKFTALLLLPGIGIVLGLVRADAGPPRRRLAGLVVAGALAWLTLSSAYLFREVFVPLESIGLRAPILARVARAAPSLRSPVPAAFLTGLDSSLSRERGLEWNIVLFGERHPRGVWFYFPVVWALKTPLLLALLAIAGIALAVSHAGARANRAWLALLLNLLLTLAYFCLVFAVQKGLRYVLMCVPLLWLLAASGLERLLDRSRRAAAFGVVCALTVVEQLAYLGNPLAFTNAAVWPKRDVFRLFADSNVDWGQNRDKIQGWLARLGIRASRLDPIHVLPGPNVLSVNAAAGVFDYPQHRWLRQHLEPKQHLGHTYLLFEVENDDFDRFMNEERRLGEAADRETCPPPPADATKPAGTQVPFVRESPPEASRAWVACVTSERGVDVGFRQTDGQLRVGRLTVDRRCDADLLQDEQVVWYRLSPGTHALCAIEVENRRAHLPYRSEGYWVLRGAPAALSLRALPLDASGVLTP